MSKTLGTQHASYLQELQSIDFVLVDLTLYLDTHPQDAGAVAQFQQFQRRKMTVTSQYERLYGPLRQYGNSSTGETWAWSKGPWPWQI
ncbi:MAG: spore coat protein CotJB [Alicyclobacillaceae bacterium]|uniref:spore coat protein CotJB n=1 Tax=Alicyclobacillus sp. SP_1 TaxID=2942475 RepID=UPI0021587278|nr:spore coat protein CotJB [Alicyclobacillus sp. SP_1]MCY0888068.1 spore coat protein CotJB [Alicyclobacillaceae bacterium]MCY0895647.1 spore coat protein CotJB [Alicyclobacillaceae bacterium]